MGVDNSEVELLGPEEGVVEAVEEGLRARSRLSIDSMRSFAKRVIAKSRAAWTSRLVRSWRLRYSATERRYLSYIMSENFSRC